MAGTTPQYEIENLKSRIPTDEYVSRGNVGCPGCGAVLGMRHALKIMGRDTIVVMPACCWGIIAGPFPSTSLQVPLLHVPFAAGAACAGGVRQALERQGRNHITVMVWAGDGGTFDIGLQALSCAAERDEDIVFVCYDNEAYMNTGIQRSGATPVGAWTTTTPYKRPNPRPKKNLMEIMAAHRIPYAATATPAFPEDLIRKFRKAKALAGKGLRFIHILSPCPPGWKMASDYSIHVARLAVESRVFPLYEIEDGGKSYTINYWPKGIPVEDYLKIQGRFRHLFRPGGEKWLEAFKQDIEDKWNTLVQKHIATHGTTDNIPRGFYK